MSDELDYKAEVKKKFPTAWIVYGQPEGYWVSPHIEWCPYEKRIGEAETIQAAWQDAYEKHCNPAPVSKEVSAEAERLQAQRDSMDATIPFAELYERSKDDRGFIAGSEVREVIGAYRRCLQQLGREQPTLPPTDGKGEPDFQHEEDCPCYGDTVPHSKDCKSCSCEKAVDDGYVVKQCQEHGYENCPSCTEDGSVDCGCMKCGTRWYASDKRSPCPQCGALASASSELGTLGAARLPNPAAEDSNTIVAPMDGKGVELLIQQIETDLTNVSASTSMPSGDDEQIREDAWYIARTTMAAIISDRVGAALQQAEQQGESLLEKACWANAQRIIAEANLDQAQKALAAEAWIEIKEGCEMPRGIDPFELRHLSGSYSIQWYAHHVDWKRITHWRRITPPAGAGQ